MTEIIKISMILVFGVIALNFLAEPNTEIYIGTFNTHILYVTIGLLMVGWLVSCFIYGIFFNEFNEEYIEGW
jgi:hypothetical protein